MPLNLVSRFRHLVTPAPRLHITSCGRVVCHSCIPSLGAFNCPTCRGPCTRTIPLNSKAPPNVLNLFKDVSGQL